MRGMRRKNDDAPVISRDEFRAKIAADTESYLASGGGITRLEQADTNLINGLPANLLSKNHLGVLGRKRKGLA